MAIPRRVRAGLSWLALFVALATVMVGSGLLVGGNGAGAVWSAAAVDAGTLTCTTNASGYCAGQPHQLGTAPVAILATVKAPIGGNPIGASIDTDSFTATSFRIRVFQPNGSAVANHAVTYSYAAYAGPAVPTTTTPAPTPTPTDTPTPTPTPTGNAWPAPGTVGLRTATTRNWGGGRISDAAGFTAAGFTGTGTQADPYTLDRVTVTNILRLGCACGATNLTNTWVDLTNDWLQGFTGNPTPDDSRMLVVENDGPHVAIRNTNLRPAGALNPDGIRTDNACTDSVILTYRPVDIQDSWISGGAILFHAELERNETGTVIRHSELHGICSNTGDHTDIINENGHGSNTSYRDNYLDGTRSGGAVVNNAFGLYNDNIGQCDACATTQDHVITGNRVVHYNIGVLSSKDTALTLGPWVVVDNVLDSPTQLGASPGTPYGARTPTTQSGNTVNGTAVTF